MRTKEEYYELILENRRLAKDPEVLKCPCPSIQCEWHGRCKECVALHRYHKEHIPTCLQPLLSEKLKELVQVVELSAAPKEKTPTEYRDYVRKRDQDQDV